MKRLLTIMLTLVLVASLLPMTTYADTSTKTVNTVDELTAALSDETIEKIVLGKSIDAEYGLQIYRTVTIDLNGNTLSFDDDDEDLDIYDTAVLTIMDSGDNGKLLGEDLDTHNESSLVINGGTIDIQITHYGDKLTINDGLVIKEIQNRSILILNGGTITSTEDYTIYNAYIMYANGGKVIGKGKESLRNWGIVYCGEESIGTRFQGMVTNCYEKCAIYGGIYESNVKNRGLIAGGTFMSTINNVKDILSEYYKGDPVIKGGMFYGEITGEYTLSGLTVTYNVDSTKYALLVLQAKEKAYAPITPTSGHLVLEGWYNQTTKYDFNTVVEENITLDAKFDHPWGEWTNNGVLTHIRYCTNADCDASQTGECASDYVANCEGGVSCSKCGAKMNEADPNNHTKLKYYPKVEATKSSEGHVAYWYCEGCEKYYLDEQATKLINKEDTIIPKLKTDRVPNTGDNSIKWFALMTVSGTLLVAIEKKRKKVK